MRRDLFRDDVRYVIDTCSLIDLHQWYPPQIAQGVWEKIDEMLDGGALISVEEVLEELKVQDDHLFAWAKRRRKHFMPLELDLQQSAKKILESYPDLVDYKRRRSSADPFVVAAAQLVGAVVVTEEKLARKGERPKIPNVCHGLGIDCISVVRMLEREDLRLIQSKGAGGDDPRQDAT